MSWTTATNLICYICNEKELHETQTHFNLCKLVSGGEKYFFIYFPLPTAFVSWEAGIK